MSTNPPLSMADRARRARTARWARHDERMSAFPFGLVPASWLAPIAGISVSSAEARTTAAPVRLSVAGVRRFGKRAESFATWVGEWGLTRVLAFLDKHDAEKAAFLRANVDGITPAAKKPALTPQERVAKATAASVAVRVEQCRAKRKAMFDGVPIGLVPASLCAVVSGADRGTVRAYIIEQGLTSVSGINWPKPVGSWSKLIEAWGVERAREWVTRHAPDDIRTFERDAAGAARVMCAADVLRSQPVAYLPPSAFAPFGLNEKSVANYRARHGIASQYGRGRDRFKAFIAAYGQSAAREWLLTHSPELVAQFDADLAPVVPRVQVVKPVAEKPVAPEPAYVPKPKTEAEIARRPLPPTPRDVDEKPEPIRAHSVAEWLAAGGQVKRGLPSGWADPTSPSYMPDEVKRRRGTGLYSGKKGWRRA